MHAFAIRDAVCNTQYGTIIATYNILVVTLCPVSIAKVGRLRKILSTISEAKNVQGKGAASSERS